MAWRDIFQNFGQGVADVTVEAIGARLMPRPPAAVPPPPTLASPSDPAPANAKVVPGAPAVSTPGPAMRTFQSLAANPLVWVVGGGALLFLVVVLARR